jgi:hypothetical protein
MFDLLPEMVRITGNDTRDGSQQRVTSNKSSNQFSDQYGFGSVARVSLTDPKYKAMHSPVVQNWRVQRNFSTIAP